MLFQIPLSKEAVTMTFFCDMIYLVTVLLFGTAVSFCFAGITAKKKKNILAFLLFCVLEGILQIGISWYFDKSMTKQFYPIFTHLPLLLFLVLVMKCQLLNAITSILSAYLCCHIPWWISYFLNLFFPGKVAYSIIFVLSATLTFIAIYKYIAEPLHHFMNHSQKTALLLGSVPFFYYCFDYATAVYTDWLYSGNKAVIQFMPTVIAFFHFLFTIIYHRELTLKEEADHQSETLSLQIQHAAATLDNMRQLQDNTITYRHDMRHHLGCIQALAASGNLEKLQQYIHALQSDIETVTPKKFCQNEVISLILSTYDLKATKKGILLDIHADVPGNISISDTHLCTLLSNALENALNATIEAADKTISVRLAVRSSSLLIQISNPFQGEITFADNLPVSTKENHGLGSKSIAAIVNSYNGQYEFFAEHQLFTMRILLPL